MGLIFNAFAALVLCAGVAQAESPRTIIVMDGSGSMWGQIDERAKLEIARETVSDVLAQLPADQSIGLMAYGHRRKGDCSDIELMVAPAPGTGADIAARVNAMRFLGKTPLSEAVRRAAEALNFGEAAANVVLVTDGLETCDADPCALGRELDAAGFDFTAHVIGFGLTREEGAQVACLADNTGGRYIDARNASDLGDALSNTIAARVPAPPPATETAPAALANAGLLAPDDAPIGSMVDVAWTVSDADPYDTISIGHPDQDGYIYYVYAAANPVALQMPGEIGAYELRYVSKDNHIVHRRPITVVEAPLALNAPDQVIAGGFVPVKWQGPDADYDSIHLRLPASEGYISYGYVRGENPVMLRAPDEVGTYELAYMLNDAKTMVTRTLDVLAAGSVVAPIPASLSASDQTEAGEDFMVGWSGPGSKGDYIYLRLPGDSGYISYAAVADGNPVTMMAPAEIGIYELVYMLGDAEPLIMRQIEVVHAVALPEVSATDSSAISVGDGTAQAAPAAETATTDATTTTLDPRSVMPVTITLEAEGAGALLSVQWSLVFTPDSTAAGLISPEVITLHGDTGPVTLEVFGGGYDVRGDAGDQVFTGHIDVAFDKDTHFVIPLDRTQSPAGEDAASLNPTDGDPVALTIKGSLPFLTQWRASPASGQDSMVLGTDYMIGGWQTALDPGRWLIEGFTGGNATHQYAAALDVDLAGPTDFTLFPPSPVSQTAIVLPTGEIAAAHCVGEIVCHYNAEQDGLQYLLLPEWASSPAVFYQTAAGATAAHPSASFFAGSPMAFAAELNPRQWDASLGNCSDIPLGQVCAVRGADPAGVALLVSSIAPATAAPPALKVAPTSDAAPTSPRAASVVDEPIDLPAGFNPVEWFAPGFLIKE